MSTTKLQKVCSLGKAQRIVTIPKCMWDEFPVGTIVDIQKPNIIPDLYDIVIDGNMVIKLEPVEYQKNESIDYKCPKCNNVCNTIREGCVRSSSMKNNIIFYHTYSCDNCQIKFMKRSCVKNVTER